MSELIFEVPTPLGFTVRCSRKHWDFIVSEKHPALSGREEDVRRTLTDPDEVLLFYRGDVVRWLCAVVRREDGSGFVITAYPTDAIKAGDALWIRSK